MSTKIELGYDADTKLFTIKLQHCNILIDKSSLLEWFEGEKMNYTEIRKKRVNQTVDAYNFAFDFIDEASSRERILDLLIDFYAGMYQCQFQYEIWKKEEKKAESIVCSLSNEDFVNLPDYGYDKDAVKGCLVVKEDDRDRYENAIPEGDDDDNWWDYGNMMCEGDDYAICGFTKMVQVDLTDESKKSLYGMELMKHVRNASYIEKLNAIRLVMSGGDPRQGLSPFHKAPKKCSFKVVCR